MRRILAALIAAVTLLSCTAMAVRADPVIVDSAPAIGLNDVNLTGIYMAAINTARYQSADKTTYTLADMAGRRLQAYGLIDDVQTDEPVLYQDMLAIAGDIIGSRFTDVDDSLQEAVNWAVSKGVTSGTSATTFSPGMTVTRGQAVTFLWRAAGSPAVSGDSFADVAPDAYYSQAVQWAVQRGITSGTSSTTYSPDATCTRGQILTMLWRANGSPDEQAREFADGAYYEQAVQWAVDMGLFADANIQPDDACLRGDMISFIYQLLADETEAATRDNALQAISRLAGETLQPAGMSLDGFTAGDMYLLLDALMDTCWYDPDHVEAQVAVPYILSLDASDQADAEQQIAQALQYAPHYIYLTMSAPGAADSLYHDLQDWLSDDTLCAMLLGCIQTGDDNTVVADLGTNGSLLIDIDYAEGWLTYVDSMDWLRVFESEAYSRMLEQFAEEKLEPIAKQNLSDAAAYAAIASLALDTAAYDFDKGSYDMQSASYYAMHSPYGALKNGLVVCDGFAHLYQFMASYMGLQAPLIYTTSHAYNKVLLDDTWYVVDITIGACGWDAQEFFLTSDAIHESHYSGETYCRSWYVTVCACPSSRPDLAYLIA